MSARRDVPAPEPRRAWDVLVLGAALVLAFVVPLGLVTSRDQQVLAPVWEGLVTLLFGADLLVRIRRQRQGSSATLRGKETIWLVADVLAAIPLGPISQLPAAGMLRLFKLARAGSLVHGWWREVVAHPVLRRLSVFLFALALSAHWLACGWMWLGGPGPLGNSQGSYLDSLYWSVTTLTTVGYGDVTPATASQTVYTMVVMLLGVGLYGFVIGNVATILTKTDLARAQYVASLERLSAFLRYRRIPPELQQHIYDYYKYLWERQMGYDEDSVLEGLPPTLRRELAVVLRSDLIEKLSFLEGASRKLVQDLCVRLEPVLVSPGETIVREGEPARHVYFIESGQVEVVTGDDDTVLSTLSDGDFFGEVALLREQRRTATVRASGYCDLYTLDRKSFSETLTRYPEFAKHFERTVSERTGEVSA